MFTLMSMVCIFVVQAFLTPLTIIKAHLIKILEKYAKCSHELEKISECTFIFVDESSSGSYLRLSALSSQRLQ